MDEWTLVGHAAVDSGQLCISDPCYTWDYDTEVLPEAAKASYRYPYTIKDGLAVVSPTLYGDGIYPVYVKYNGSGYATAMMVDFDPLESEYDDYEDEEEEDD